MSAVEPICLGLQIIESQYIKSGPKLPENFPLYHNGINILCEQAKLEEDKLLISNYVVVNGAQSISTFKKTSSYLTDDLRVIAKIIEVSNTSLSRKITINSNNQNAIKPRDLKSTNEVQMRLREEFSKVVDGEYEFEIKRGQEKKPNTTVITNEEAGRLLLAFDLLEPESCHQVYKLFDEKYTDIFARPAVTAYRIICLHKIMERVYVVIPEITNRPLSRYGLTRFFLLSVVAELIKLDDTAVNYLKSPEILFSNCILDNFLDTIESVLRSIVIDLNYEIEDSGGQFDYKGELKSPTKTRELRAKLLRSYEKDVARGKARAISDIT